MKKFWDSTYRGASSAPVEEVYEIYKEREEGATLPKVLAFVALFIVVAIIFITAAAFATHKATFAAGLRRGDPKPESAKTSKYASYTELGQMRLQTADENCVLVLEPWFPYEPSDTEFVEEIGKKSRALKIAITSYFHSKSKQELLDAGENAVKKELLDEINNQLVMGKFNAIYFSEYLFLN